MNDDKDASVTIPASPSRETLLAMARRLEPSFDARTTKDVIGLSDADREGLVSRMADVYAAIVGGDAVVVPTGSEDAGAWGRGDWLRHLTAEQLTRVLSRFQHSHSRHWRRADGIESGPGFPLVVRNQGVGPLLAMRSADAARPGLVPYVVGADPDGYHWYIDRAGLERWWAVPFPETAAGWLELFSREPQERMLEIFDTQQRLDAFKEAVLSKDESAIDLTMDLFFMELVGAR